MIAFIIGLFIGANVGVLVGGLLCAAARADKPEW